MTLLASIRTNTHKYGAVVNSHDVFKCLAVLLMTVDHIGFFFAEDNLWLRAIGRWCVPIWFFFVGYARPSRTDSTLFFLAASMIVADIVLIQAIFPVNILGTIILTRLVMRSLANNDKDLFVFTMVLFGCAALFPLTYKFFEYGTQVIPISLAGFYMRQMPQHWVSRVALIVSVACFTVLQYFSFDMTMAQGIFMGIGMVLIVLLLDRFTLREHPALSASPALNYTMRAFGRNTHYYYAIHYVLFTLIQRWMGEQEAWHIIWFAM